MHIPDSVLSPVTSVAAGAAMLPVWTLAARRARQTLGTRQVPMLALGAAFCFTVMLFNIPALGGTTAHPVAGTLLAILLGPWAACIGISVALLIQALFFGDGGLLAYGANCFTMAFVLPFVGYSIYRLLASRREQASPVIPLCAAIGSFVGINVAAAMVALLLGIQPALFHEPNGHALYFPFGLHITLPAMLSTHLIVAGPAEAIVTALVARYLQTANIPLYGFAATAKIALGDAGQKPESLPMQQEGTEPLPVRAGRQRTGQRGELLWIGLLALVALSPLGLLAKGEAWGEWDAKGIAEQTEKRFGAGKGYTPKRLAQTEAHGYKGLHGLEDYASDEGKNHWGYLGAGLLGVGVITSLLLLGGRLLARHEKAEKPQPPGRLSSPNSFPRTEDKEPGEEQNTTLSRSFGRGTGDEGSREGLPDWMQTPTDERGNLPEQRRRSNRFLERTLKELSLNAANAMNGDQWTNAPGALQRIDPRAKIMALLLLIGVTAWARQPTTLLLLYAFALLFGIGSRLPVGLLLRRVWLAVPLFVGALILPALLNLVTPGREVLLLWRHPHIAITLPGVLLALTLLLRVGTAVTFALLLTLTTRWNDLLRALRALFVPRLFLSVLAMTYRYLAVLMQSAGEMFTARQSRTVGAATNAQGRQFIGVSIGALLGKTVAMADEVHAAMLSRGYNGEMRTLARWKWRRGDTLWMAGILLLAVLAWKQG